MGKFKEYEHSAYQSENLDQPSFIGLIDIIKKFTFSEEHPPENKAEAEEPLGTAI